MLRGEKDHSSRTCLWQKPDPCTSRRYHLRAIAHVMTASGVRGWRHTAAMIAYDDVDNDRGSATGGGGGGEGGGRSPSRQAGIDVALFRCRASFFQFAVSSTSFGFRTFTTNEERRSSIRDTGRTHDSDPL